MSTHKPPPHFNWNASDKAIHNMETYINMHKIFHEGFRRQTNSNYGCKKIAPVHKMRNILPGVTVIKYQQHNNNSQYVIYDSSARKDRMATTSTPESGEKLVEELEGVGCFGRAKSNSLRRINSFIFPNKEKRNTLNSGSGRLSKKDRNYVKAGVFSRILGMRKPTANNRQEIPSPSVYAQLNRDYLTSVHGINWKLEDPSYEQTNPSEVDMDFSLESSASSNQLSATRANSATFQRNYQPRMPNRENLRKFENQFSCKSAHTIAEGSFNPNEFTNQFNSEKNNLDNESQDNDSCEDYEYDANGDPKPLGWVCIPFPVFSNSSESTIGNPGDAIPGHVPWNHGNIDKPQMIPWQPPSVSVSMQGPQCFPPQPFNCVPKGYISRCPHKITRTFVCEPNPPRCS